MMVIAAFHAATLFLASLCRMTQRLAAEALVKRRLNIPLCRMVCQAEKDSFLDRFFHFRLTVQEYFKRRRFQAIARSLHSCSARRVVASDAHFLQHFVDRIATLDAQNDNRRFRGSL